MIGRVLNNLHLRVAPQIFENFLNPFVLIKYYRADRANVYVGQCKAKAGRQRLASICAQDVPAVQGFAGGQIVGAWMSSEVISSTSS